MRTRGWCGGAEKECLKHTFTFVSACFYAATAAMAVGFYFGCANFAPVEDPGEPHRRGPFGGGVGVLRGAWPEGQKDVPLKDDLGGCVELVLHGRKAVL